MATPEPMPAPVPVSPTVPAKIRFVLYWASFFLSMIAGLVSSAWQIIAASSDDVSAPLWVKLLPALLLLVVAQLNALAGSNVITQTNLAIPAVRENKVTDERGATSLLLIGIVLAVLGLLLVVLTTVDVIGWILLAVGAGLALYAAVASSRGTRV